MRGLARRPPSPAMVLAMIALFVALGGTGAYALAGRNTVDSGDIINRQVRSADLQNGGVGSVDLRDGGITGVDVGAGSLSGSEIEDGGLSGADVADDSLGGSDIAEPGLAKVPSAAAADSALSAGSVGGSRVIQFEKKTTSETGLVTVVNNLGGLTLRLGCAGSSPRLQATTAVDDAYLHTLPGADTDVNFDTGETKNIINWPDNVGSGTAVYRSNSGDVVTITVAYHDATEAGTGCMAAGTAVGG